MSPRLVNPRVARRVDLVGGIGRREQPQGVVQSAIRSNHANLNLTRSVDCRAVGSRESYYLTKVGAN
jgi:hypothetical protein